jgi:hypothetical protein
MSYCKKKFAEIEKRNLILLSHSFTLDGLLHCKTEQEAKNRLELLIKRFAECGLQLHAEKTKIIYCKDSNRVNTYPNTSFDFLGYTFRARQAKKKNSKILFISFTPAVSNQAKKTMREKTRRCRWHLRSDLELEEIASQFNPVIRGWINYYGRYYPSALNSVGAHFNSVLVKWAMRKYKKFRTSYVDAVQYIKKTAQHRSGLFVHWASEKKIVFA